RWRPVGPAAAAAPVPSRGSQRLVGRCRRGRCGSRWPTRRCGYGTARVEDMTHQVYAFEPPERFVAGTVGPPGERIFYLQARGGGERGGGGGGERRGGGRPGPAPGTADPGRDPQLHRRGPPRGGRRSAALPAVRPAAGSQGPPLPPPQRLPPVGARRVPTNIPARGAPAGKPERRLPETDALDLLRHGTIELEGRLVEASNTTLRAHISLDGV